MYLIRNSLLKLSPLARTAYVSGLYCSKGVSSNWTRAIPQTAPRLLVAQVQPFSSLRRDRILGSRNRVHKDIIRRQPKDRVDNVNPELAVAESIPSAQSTTVQVPIDPNGTLDINDPAARILEHGTLVITRQLEMLNVFMGFEQANKYAIADQYGNYLGFLAEEDSFGNTLARQFLRTHRKFNATVLDKEGNVVLKIHRPFSLINSRIFIYRSDDTLIGEVQQEWHLWRRAYNLFIGERQFARIDSGFLSWEFLLQTEDGGMLGHVTRNFGGFAREIFTDTGTYMLKMDDVEDNARLLTLDERAVTLASAVTIDFDYFSRHSRHGGGFPFFPIPFFGDEYRDDDSGPAPPPPSAPSDSSSEAGAATGFGVGSGLFGSDAFLPDDEEQESSWGNFWSDDD